MASNDDDGYFSNVNEFQNNFLCSITPPAGILSQKFTDQIQNNGKRRDSRRKRTDDRRDKGLFFYVENSNEADLIYNYCVNREWKRIIDNIRLNYLLKGKQTLYHIPNNRFLTTKVGLCTSLKDQERRSNRCIKFRCSKKSYLLLSTRLLKLDEFYPETYRMDVAKERVTFFDVFKDGQIWICKPAESSLGRGIFLLRNRDDVAAFRSKLESVEKIPQHRLCFYNAPIHRIVQRYIHNPLLLDGRKFDVRSYFLIACTSPYVTFFHHGYVKVTCNQYHPNSDDLTGHLTNQFMQKKNPNYNEVMEETIWSMERLNNYINERFRIPKAVPKDWVFTVFERRMQQIMRQCFISAKSRLECKLGYFDLLGCDFIVDQNFKVWLLEMNSSPSLERHCEVLKNVIPSLVTEALDIVIEIFIKSGQAIPILPLQAQRKFILLYHTCFLDLNLNSISKSRAENIFLEKIPHMSLSTYSAQSQKRLEPSASFARTLTKLAQRSFHSRRQLPDIKEGRKRHSAKPKSSQEATTTQGTLVECKPGAVSKASKASSRSTPKLPRKSSSAKA
ncbi:protein polyglycylase TTLL10-like [Callorhinchus milii]|uniref:protein polyglycylase TTLL10-like n=1 Tax=Callorhinchus milii TaxID=7868 RepID=UPI0004573ED0|nr:protein polyglycylase TTLL10-like [Callorhinchus milii]|eukprot:gi/632977114/ref/XP_007905165.1/ PREDICTED: protein polyglycylase TTLL10-like [Callorhinchus milii]